MDGASVSKMFAVPCAVALAAAVSACAGDRTASTAGGHEGAPINLTGCLQKGGGMTSSYVLTQVNEPTRSVGTSGAAETPPGAVEREQMREAKHAYRLDGDDDQLDSLIGKQVRVQGTIAENSDLNAKQADRDRADANKPADINPGDLAEVKVQSISAVADACSDSADQRR